MANWIGPPTIALLAVTVLVVRSSALDLCPDLDALSTPKNDTDIANVKCVCICETGKCLAHCLFDVDVDYINAVIQERTSRNYTISSMTLNSIANNSNGTLFDVLPETLEELEIRHCQSDFRSHNLYKTTSRALSNLRVLKINNCRLTDIADSGLQKATNLEVLSLRGNSIEKVYAQSFINNGKLIHLDLSENIVSEVERGAFSPLVSLRKLSFGNHNNVTTSVRTEISQLPLLEELSLNKADNVFDLDSFALSNHIHVLDLSGCGLQNLTSIPYSNTLEYLDITVNLIEVIQPNAFENVSSLTHLSLAGNFINETSFNYTAWVGLDRLLQLDLSYNEFHTLGEQSFGPNLKQLQRLNLNSNGYLSNIQLGAFNGMELLEMLNISHSGIKSLPPNVFINNRRLKVLDVSKAKLAFADERAFAGLESSLTDLNIAGNLLTVFPTDALSNLSQIERLDLSNNPFICDKGIFEAQQWITSTSRTAAQQGRPFELLNPNATTCSYPKHLDGRNIMDIRMTDLTDPPSTTLAPTETTEQGFNDTFDLSLWSVKIGEGNDTLLAVDQVDDKPTYDINSIRYGQRQTKNSTPTNGASITAAVLLVLVTIGGLVYVVRRKNPTENCDNSSVSPRVTSAL